MASQGGNIYMSKLEAVAARMEALAKERERLSTDVQAEAENELTARAPQRDTYFKIRISFNSTGSMRFSEKPARISVPGADFAFQEVYAGGSKHSGENSVVGVMLGQWKSTANDQVIEPVFEPKAPYLRLQNVLIEIEADKDRALQLARQLKMNALRTQLR